MAGRDCTGSDSLEEICNEIERTVTHTLVKGKNSFHYVNHRLDLFHFLLCCGLYDATNGSKLHNMLQRGDLLTRDFFQYFLLPNINSTSSIPLHSGSP